MTSTVSGKGQITIPKALRDKVGIRAGTLLDFEAEQGRLVARKHTGHDMIRKWRGRGNLPGSIGVTDY
jgi:AbrB family looped-hinge helix DNA binding protein